MPGGLVQLMVVVVECLPSRIPCLRQVLPIQESTIMLLESVTVVSSGVSGGTLESESGGSPSKNNGQKVGPLVLTSLLRRLPDESSDPESELTEEKTRKNRGESEGEEELIFPSSPSSPSSQNSNTNQRVTTSPAVMADKRRYFERDRTGGENNNSYDSGSRHSAGSGGGKGHGYGGSSTSDYDNPPNSRLFILCGRNVTEGELRESFERFGEIKELWIVKDKASGESKGMLACYSHLDLDVTRTISITSFAIH